MGRERQSQNSAPLRTPSRYRYRHTAPSPWVCKFADPFVVLIVGERQPVQPPWRAGRAKAAPEGLAIVAVCLV